MPYVGIDACIHVCMLRCVNRFPPKLFEIQCSRRFGMGMAMEMHGYLPQGFVFENIRPDNGP